MAVAPEWGSQRVMSQITRPPRGLTTIPSRHTDGQESVSGVRLADLTGQPGRDAAIQLRRAELRPAMELIPSSEPPGIVVGQIPAAGAILARESLVRLLIATATAEEPGNETDGPHDTRESDEPAEREHESAESVIARPADLPLPTPAVPRTWRHRKPGLAQAWLEDEQAGEELAHTEEKPVAAGEHAQPAEPTGTVEASIRRRIVRVRWLLVLDGRRVRWREACVICLLALLAAWGVGGSRALAGLSVAIAVLAIGVIVTGLATRGEQPHPADPDSLFIDLPERR